MKQKKEFLQLSASDLSNFLSCKHSTELDKKVAKGQLEKPEWVNPNVAVLQERGFQHEEAYIKYLENQGLAVVRIPEDKSSSECFALTVEAMEGAADIIVQGVLKQDDWFGKCDVLKKVGGHSKFGLYSYEVMDTKLSRDTKAGSILQLCLYSEMIETITGTAPDKMYVVTPGVEFNELEYRVSEYQSYYRLVRNNLIAAIKGSKDTYPEPIIHCDICKWFVVCDKQRRGDDHLEYVAGLTTSQRKELKKIDITTLEGFAKAEDDFYKKIDSGNGESLIRAKEQARMQYESRVHGKPKFEFLEIEDEKGFNRLPESCEGDYFFDLEGDQFYGESGIEYLWGFSHIKNGKLNYEHRWAFNYEDERQCFEWFIDNVIEQKKKYPKLKVYHYASYEPGALKRLMGRYGTKETEIDHLLRTGTFVDLYSIARQCVRAGIEKYSIKDLEQFYGYSRMANLRDVGPHKRLIEHSLELNKLGEISIESKEIVRIYNQDDADSTYYLYQWLEKLRAELIKKGSEISRPPELDGEITEELDEHLQRLIDLRDALQKDINPIPEERTEVEKAKWLLGDLIAFYRREDKVNFWEKFRLKELDSLELLEDKSGISGLTYVERVGGTDRCPIHRYRFIDQIVDIKRECPVHQEGLLRNEKVKSFGTIEKINYEENYVDLKKKTGMSDFHPNAFWAWNHVDKKIKAERMFELASFVLEKGLATKEPKYKAARDIILRNKPDLNLEVNLDTEDTLALAKEMALALNNSYLAIQGPPGTGKSYSASRVVLKLIQEGYKVGVTGLSHAVISNLMNKIQEASIEESIDVNLYQKTKPENCINDQITYVDSKEIQEVLGSNKPFVLGGTDFMWAGENFEDTVDYLVVDEAGQFSLVGIMSIAHATKNIILLGDGAQLKQPIQGSHPDGCEVSALDYIVGENKTLPKEKGVFLPITYRLHPNICAFNSELFYEGRLHAISGNQNQNIEGGSRFSGVNLSLVDVEHWGNTNHSMEEVEVLKKIVIDLVSGNNTYKLFKDGKVTTAKITYDSIKIVAPYNAQVNRIKQLIPEVSVGTVDKFQGQEAPIVIYSVTTSSPEDAPRGMEFLYSGNRLNVAVSRAQCLFILVASPKIFEPDCKSPRQMRLANSYCRYRELASAIDLS